MRRFDGVGITNIHLLIGQPVEVAAVGRIIVAGVRASTPDVNLRTARAERLGNAIANAAGSTHDQHAFAGEVCIALSHPVSSRFLC